MAPVHVLQVVGQMNRGGVETWLMHVLRRADPRRLRMDFLVTREQPGEFDPEIRQRGGEVIQCRLASSPGRFARRFLHILRKRSPYRVVHSHVHHFSGFVLALARMGSVPIRVAHSHMDTANLDGRAGPGRLLYLRATEMALRSCATRGLAVTEAAAASLFGPRWGDDARWKIARCGVDLAPFQRPAEVSAVRAELGVPAGALVLGHVGRFDEFKNQAFLVQVLAAALRREPRAFLVLVGDGPLRSHVEEQAVRQGVRPRTAFPGTRSDVPRLLPAFDVFMFPSLHEGLPLALLEAQAAGLPIVLSDCITRELAAIPDLLTWLAPTEAPGRWADLALDMAGRRISPQYAVDRLERSEFSLARSISGLLEVYGAAG